MLRELEDKGEEIEKLKAEVERYREKEEKGRRFSGREEPERL